MGSISWSPTPGSIVRAEVQYSDSEQTKSRFPVVVSSGRFNCKHPDVIVAFTTKTSNIHRPQDYDVEVSGRHAGFGNTGFTVSTTVRCGRLWSIDKRKISEVIGHVPDDILVDVLHLVRDCFVEE